MFSTPKTSSVKPPVPHAGATGLGKAPPPPVQCILTAEGLKQGLASPDKVPERVYELLVEIHALDSKAEDAKTKGEYKKDNRKESLGRRLDLLEELEMAMLELPLSKLPSSEKDNRKLSHLFVEVSSERRKTQKSYDCYLQKGLFDDFPYRFENGGTYSSGINEAWPFICRNFPDIIGKIPEEVEKQFFLEDEKVAPESLDAEKLLYFVQAKDGNTLLTLGEGQEEYWHFAPNYLLLLWQMTQKLLPPKALEGEKPSFITALAGRPSLDLDNNPFFEDQGLNTSTEYEPSSTESEPELPFDLQGEWFPVKPAEPLPGFPIFCATHDADLTHTPDSLAKVDTPRLIHFQGGHRNYSFGADGETLFKWFRKGYDSIEIQRMMLAQQLLNIIGKNSFAPRWSVLRHDGKSWPALRERMRQLPAEYDRKMSVELGFGEDELKDFDVMEMINRKERAKADAPDLPEVSEGGQDFDLWFLGHKHESFQVRLREHEWPHFNDLREAFNMKSVANEGAVGLLGQQGSAYLGEPATPTPQRGFISDIWFWFAQGEAMMQSILMGNMRYQLLPYSHLGQADKHERVLLPNGMVKAYKQPESGRVSLFNDGARISETGYQHFAKRILFKNLADMPDSHLSADEVIRVIANYIFKLLTLSSSDLTYPAGPKHYQMDHGISCCSDIAGYTAQINGMLACLLSIYDKGSECLGFADSMGQEFEKERFAFHRLVQVVVRIVDHFGPDTLRKLMARRLEKIESENAFGSSSWGSMLLCQGNHYSQFNFELSTSIIRTQVGGKAYLLVTGLLLGDIYSRMVKAIEDYGDIEGIIIGHITGTRDLFETERLGTYVYQKGIKVYLPSGHIAISGGVDMFVSGNPSVILYPEGATLDKITKLGVHSWKNRTTGMQGHGLPKNHPKHEQHIKFNESVGMSREEAEKFYFFNMETPPERIHYMTEEEIRRFGIADIRPQKPDEPFSASIA
ncbi:hypothetical protein FUAX_49500 (plasmid) [Fulvitalea axinellae]|uniref:Uncharacterized protein n=1 Tax=Fulvitalea axinellae TaxID=1182444 RepID=A0AAU9D982_9BACT|nr:hypothetical protein FUAX_49500 [Fulvitalea axinellae]